MNKEMINQYIQNNKERFVEELLDLLRIPSISADPAYKADVQRTAEKVKQRLLEAGAEQVEVCATAGHPIVYGEKMISQDLPTVLVYGHYDVQPVDPIELWHSQPFEPIIKKTPLHPEGAIFARGSADDKGQAYMHIKALELMLKTNTLPCNIKLMIEGEEEVGSDNLGVFVAENKEKLKADIILISDTAILANDTPSITVGLRGLSYVEVDVTGPNRDLHSGIYGGAVANPINILCEMIASLKDKNNKITIPGFYDDVSTLNDSEKAELAKAPFNEEEYKKHLDINAVYGEKDFSTMERSSIRPTLDVNGIWGGYIGEGAKTVLPSKAFAKISMRLVPNQSSKKITELFKNYFESIAPAGVKVQVKPHHGGDPVVTPSNNPGYLAAEKAMHETFGKKPVPVRGGGSIPIVALFEKELGIKSVLMGFSLDTDAIHSPNEHYGIFNYIKGIETIPLFFYHYAQLFKK
ncbi:MAG: dipeptidase [Flavobacteriales bacterium]|nr:dipeptidase [Flavobacteriales bacterium]